MIMKLTAYLFLSLIFLTSCHSYKKFDLSKDIINAEKKYKVTTTSGKKIKDKKCELTLISLNFSKTIIPLNEIVELKERKFSYLKTMVTLIVFTGITVFAFYEFSNPVNGIQFSFQSPQ